MALQHSIVTILTVLSVAALADHHQTALHYKEDDVFNQLKKIISSAHASSKFDVACMVEHCFSESLACVTNSECRNNVECSDKCIEQWDSDPTKEKFHVQNCSNECQFTYESQAYDKFMSCISGKHECMILPTIPNTCRSPNVFPQKQLSTKDLNGTWWVVKGYHPVYDCYPCQKLSFYEINSTSWNYYTQYQAYLLNGSLKLEAMGTVIPLSEPGTNISFVYHDAGLVHNETWWLLDKADDGSFIAMYYCGNSLHWNYEGSLVLARNKTLSAQMYVNVTAAYQKGVGLDTKEFCDTGVTACPQKEERLI